MIVNTIPDNSCKLFTIVRNSCSRCAGIGVHVIAALLWRMTIGAGLLASAQLGVPAAVVSIGLSTNQLTAAQGAAVMAAVLATLAACAVGGVLFGNCSPLTDPSALVVAPTTPA